MCVSDGRVDTVWRVGLWGGLSVVVPRDGLVKSVVERWRGRVHGDVDPCRGGVDGVRPTGAVGAPWVSGGQTTGPAACGRSDHVP